MINDIHSLLDAETALLVEQLLTQQHIVVKRGSRDCVAQKIIETLVDPPLPRVPIVTRLAFHGLSPANLQLLQNALNVDHSSIRELEFMYLKSEPEVTMALDCCRQKAPIERLRLENYQVAGRMSLQMRLSLARLLAEGLFAQDNGGMTSDPLPRMSSVEIVKYPFGTLGVAILADAVSSNTSVKVLRLVDCSVRSDNRLDLARMIRRNTSLLELDLSFNKLHMDKEIVQEMTFMMLWKHGIRYNTTLRRLQMFPLHGASTDRIKIEKQLTINRFAQDVEKNKGDLAKLPRGAWPRVLSVLADRPSALHHCLCQFSMPLFGA